MISHAIGTAAAEPRKKTDFHDGNGDHGPMSLQDTMGSHGFEMHPQEFVRLVGYHDSTKLDVAHRLH